MSSITKIWWDSQKPIYEISQSKLYSLGITSLILDVDGTLLSRKTSNIPIAVKNWILKSKEYFSIYLVINNPSIVLQPQFSSLAPINSPINADLAPLSLSPPSNYLAELKVYFKCLRSSSELAASPPSARPGVAS